MLAVHGLIVLLRIRPGAPTIGRSVLGRHSKKSRLLRHASHLNNNTRDRRLQGATAQPRRLRSFHGAASPHGSLHKPDRDPPRLTTASDRKPQTQLRNLCITLTSWRGVSTKEPSCIVSRSTTSAPCLSHEAAIETASTTIARHRGPPAGRGAGA